jgi:hypothetical protein
VITTKELIIKKIKVEVKNNNLFLKEFVGAFLIGWNVIEIKW